MFMSDRSRQDIQMVLALLTTRVKKLDKYDWVKLKRVLKYLKETYNLKIALSVGYMSVVKWCVYDSD